MVRGQAPRSQVRAVFLVGFMGAGKSSVGRALGRLLGWDFEDLDDRIEQAEGRTIAEIFRDDGEERFRRAEREALRAVVRELQGGKERIVALGGGAFVQKANAERLRAAGIPTVFLDASVDELWRRCRRQAQESGNERPLLVSKERFRQLQESRRPAYMEASLRIKTGGRSVEAVADEVGKLLGMFGLLPAKKTASDQG